MWSSRAKRSRQLGVAFVLVISFAVTAPAYGSSARYSRGPAADSTLSVRPGAEAPRPDSRPPVPDTKRTPVLLLHQEVDVNGDGVQDSVSYYSSREDGALDAQSIDFGDSGHTSVLALRCDFDSDGKDDDWM